MDKDFSYIGLFFSENETKYILNVINKVVPGLNTDNASLYCNHCTLLHKTQYYNHRDLYNTLNVLTSSWNDYYITIDAIGWTDKVLAVRVKDVKAICANKVPHITVYTFNDGKPVDSNKITHWIDIEPFKIVTHCQKIR